MSSQLLCWLGKRSKRHIKGWMDDMEKWFGRWDAIKLRHGALLDSFVNEAFWNVNVS